MSSNVQEIESLLIELALIRDDMLESANSAATLLDAIHANYVDSARNLLHYLALRRRDLRTLQLRLAALGLSSLGRSEACALKTVEVVLGALRRIAGYAGEEGGHEFPTIDLADAQRRLVDSTGALFGAAPLGRAVRIMVTMPSEAATEYSLVHDLLKLGMDCMRINCAHDTPEAWLRMIEHLRRAEQTLNRSCRVVMDLAGPKLRTGPVEPGPAVVRVRPRRNVYGGVISPARIWLTQHDNPRAAPTHADASLRVSKEWLQPLRVRERVSLIDARGSRRSFTVVDVDGLSCWLEGQKTTYFSSGLELTRRVHDDKSVKAMSPIAVPAQEGKLELEIGDLLILMRSLEPGKSATRDSSGQVLTPASIGCTLPHAFDHARPGESIWFDDGKMGGVIEAVDDECVLVRITSRLGNGKLRADKGINLPDTELQLQALGDEDIEDLAFIARHADVVELSFANCAADVEALLGRLEKLDARHVGVVLKIETRRGFENLPDMLLAAMRWPNCGVMIARGDLAVECGFERLAEVQEEILWICEAAHVPVIWATQVLETLTHQGMPTRAEITDAAMAHRAECAMLNKGPFVAKAVQVLDDILRRMQTHQSKKRAMLRELRLAHASLNNGNGTRETRIASMREL